MFAVVVPSFECLWGESLAWLNGAVVCLLYVSCNRMSALVAPSLECLCGESLVWLIGAVVCLLAAAAGPIVH